MRINPFRSPRRRGREPVKAYVLISPEGRTSVDIRGGTVAEVAQLMSLALLYPQIRPQAPARDVPAVLDGESFVRPF